MGDYNAPQYRCGNPETLATAQLNKLRTNRPKVWFEGSPPGYTTAQWKALYFEWANKWSRVANVECSEAGSRASAHWIVTVIRMDGRNGVLADATLPGPAQQQNRYDVSDTTNPRQLGQTVLHEVGHLYGLVHLESSPPPDVMEPSLNPALSEPQTTESKLMASMYGPPAVAPVPAQPTASGLTCTVRLADDGKTIGCEIEASKPGFAATLKGSKPWQASQPIYVAPYPVQEIQLPVEQREEWDVPDTDLE